MIIELSFDDDITKPIISLGHIFSLSSICILQGRSLSLSLHRSQRLSINIPLHVVQLLSPPQVADHLPETAELHDELKLYV